jgi:hypothetical protein
LKGPGGKVSTHTKQCRQKDSEIYLTCSPVLIPLLLNTIENISKKKVLV